MAYQPVGPSFAFCGTFSGNDSISAVRWLRKFEHEIVGYRVNGTVPPDKYLSSVDMLLMDDAAEWAESYPEAIRLLKDPNPTQESVNTFKALLCDRFPAKVVEVVTVPIDVELSGLKQRTDESLASYYKRVTGLMQRAGARDRAAPPGNLPLSPLESTFLDIILRAFIKGIIDPEVRKEATRGMASVDRSLKTIYQLAEEARRTNWEIQKLYKEELRDHELAFYKNLAQKSMPMHKIEAMLTSYRANKRRPFTPEPWTVHVDPNDQPFGTTSSPG